MFSVADRAVFSNVKLGGDDARNFEPKVRLKFEDLDKSIQRLRDIYKVHPEWFEVPNKRTKKLNVVEYPLS